MKHAIDRDGALSVAFVLFVIFGLGAVFWHLKLECDARCGGDGRGVLVQAQCLCGPSGKGREP